MIAQNDLEYLVASETMIAQSDLEDEAAWIKRDDGTKRSGIFRCYGTNNSTKRSY